jgi:hypothetical protein
LANRRITSGKLAAFSAGDDVPKVASDETPPSLKDGDGGGTSGDMETRVTRLEEQMSLMREDLRDIKADLKILPTLATKRDNANAFIVAATLSLAIVGVVIGGLGWLETRASRVTSPPPVAAAAPQPIIIEIPQPVLFLWADP